MVRALADVTLNVNDIPIDPSPFSSFLVGRLAGRAGLPPLTITIIALFVDVEKEPDHVKMWEAGLEAGKNETGGDDERRSNRTPKPSEERALIETTGMSWVEQAALRGAMAKVWAYRSRVSRYMRWATRATLWTRRSSSS